MTEQQIIETLATKVMGWERMFHEGMQLWGWKREMPHYFRSGWNPLQNIADAWQLVEKLRNGCWFVQNNVNHGQIDHVEISTSVMHLEHPRKETVFYRGICGAISRAAIKAIGE